MILNEEYRLGIGEVKLGGISLIPVLIFSLNTKIWCKRLNNILSCLFQSLSTKSLKTDTAPVFQHQTTSLEICAEQASEL